MRLLKNKSLCVVLKRCVHPYKIYQDRIQSLEQLKKNTVIRDTWVFLDLDWNKNDNQFCCINTHLFYLSSAVIQIKLIIIIGQNRSKIRWMKSFLIINFKHVLFTLGFYLLYCFVLHLVDTFIQGIFCKITFSSRNAFPAATFNLQIAVVNNIDIRRTHVYCLWILINFFLASLAEHRILFLERD